MSPLRSSAGPGDLADADAELVADDLRERRLAEPGRPGEQDVVERLPARLGGLEGDRELLLDALLADEVGQVARPQRPLELLLARRRATGARNWLMPPPAATCAHLFLDRQLGIDLGERALGVEQRPAELDERVASDEVVARRRRVESTSGSFSFSSSTTRCAVFSPTPGIAWKRFTSSRAIARRSSAGVEPETIASATFGPTPETPSSSSKSSRSSAVAKPKSASVSSRTTVWISIVDLAVAEALHGRRRADEVADAVHVDDEPLPRAAGDPSTQPGDHAVSLISGGTSAWQIATASASAAWFGAGTSSSAEDRLHHLPHLLLVGAAVAADRLLDPRGRVLSARDAGGRRGDEHGSPCLPDGECDAGVCADERLLQGDGIRRVFRDQLLDAREDREQTSLQSDRAATFATTRGTWP